MVKSKRLSNAVVVGLLALFTAAGVWAETSAKPTGDELLQMVPAESLFCVRVNNFDYTLSQIDQFLAGISPKPSEVSKLVRKQFAKMLGSPDLKGVNMGGSFAIFGVVLPGTSAEANPIENVFLGGFVPVTDYQQFLSGNPNCSQPDEKGVSMITLGPLVSFVVTQVNNYALVSPADSSGSLNEIAKSISSDRQAALAGILDTDEAKQAIREPIWAYGNIQLASDIFGPMVFGQLEQMKTMIESVEANAPGTQPRNIQKIIDMYAGILETLMKETKSLSIAVNPEPTVLNITTTISAVPGTDMADMFTADDSAKQENKLLCYLEDGAVMNVSGKVTGKLNAKAMDFFATIISKNMSAEDTAKIKSFASDSATVFSGNDAMSFSVDPKNKPPFAMKYVIEIKDKDKFDKVVEEGVKLFNTGGIADFYESIGMKTSFMLERGVDRYKGGSIDSAKLIMKSTEPNSPQGQMINAMYGEGFDYRWSIVDGLLVCVMGGDVDSAIRKLIDEVKAGGPKQLAGEMKAALAIIPEASKADFVGTYNFLRWFKIIGAMMPAPAPIPQMDIPTKSNIVFAGKIGQGKMTFEIALPKEHLTEIMAAVQMMQQKMKTQQQPTANLRKIGLACLIYANDYDDKFPPNLQELVEKVELPPKCLESPRKPKGFDGPSYIYIAGQSLRMPPGNIVAYENPAFCSDKIGVLFLDTHVQAMKPGDFLQELEATYKRLGRQMPEIKFKDSTRPMLPKMFPVDRPMIQPLFPTDTALVIASEEVTGEMSVKVAGVRLVRYSDYERGIMPLGQTDGYTLSLIAELPTPVIKASGGKIEKATTDTGKSLLPEHQWGRKIKFPRLAKDKKTVVFDVELLLPDEDVEGLEELSGTLEYLTADASREVDLGIMDFEVGAKGRELGTVIRSIEEDPWQKNATMLSLRLNLRPEAVESAEFFAQDGTKLDVSKRGYESIAGTTTLKFSIKGKLPPKGRIVLNVFEGLKKNEIPFEITEISLTGRSLW